MRYICVCETSLTVKNTGPDAASLIETENYTKNVLLFLSFIITVIFFKRYVHLHELYQLEKCVVLIEWIQLINSQRFHGNIIVYLFFRKNYTNMLILKWKHLKFNLQYPERYAAKLKINLEFKLVKTILNIWLKFGLIPSIFEKNISIA